MSKKKSTKKREKVSNNKKTRQKVDANSFLSKKPAWNFTISDIDYDKWCIHHSCSNTLELIEKLKKFEGMTWDEIMIRDKKKHHHIGVDSCIKEAQKRLSELHIYDDELFSLRLTGKTRIYGLLNDGVFSIIWYDCNHEICPSEIKRT